MSQLFFRLKDGSIVTDEDIRQTLVILDDKEYNDNIYASVDDEFIRKKALSYGGVKEEIVDPDALLLYSSGCKIRAVKLYYEFKKISNPNIRLAQAKKEFEERVEKDPKSLDYITQKNIELLREMIIKIRNELPQKRYTFDLNENVEAVCSIIYPNSR